MLPDVVDHAAIPDFSAGAMENWGLVLYRESALLHDDAVSSMLNKYWVSLVIAHEIAHTVGALSRRCRWMQPMHAYVLNELCVV